MDLSLIGQRLKDQEYKDYDGFCNDVLQMFENAYIFNPHGHFVRDHARELGKWFDQQVQVLFHVHLNWESRGIHDLYSETQNVYSQKPRKRRLGSYRLHVLINLNVREILIWNWKI